MTSIVAADAGDSISTDLVAADAGFSISTDLVAHKNAEFNAVSKELTAATEKCGEAAEAGEAVQKLCADELRAFAVLGDAGPEAAALVAELSGLEQKLNVLVQQANFDDTHVMHISCNCCGWGKRMGKYANRLRACYVKVSVRPWVLLHMAARL